MENQKIIKLLEKSMWTDQKFIDSYAYNEKSDNSALITLAHGRIMMARDTIALLEGKTTELPEYKYNVE